jgi:uracil-DNA glycosylase family 4
MPDNSKDKGLQIFCAELGADEVMANQPINRYQETPAPSKVIAKEKPKAAMAEGGKLAYRSGELSNQEARSIAESVTSLEALRDAVMAFEGCALKMTATNTVFADGNPDSGIMVIGEAPGATEDLKGIPFCGESGQLLDAMFAAIGRDRSSLYISNTIFWRPPGNRRPTAEETSLCLAFGEKHIALVKPKAMILVGATAAATFLPSDTPVTMAQLRKSVHQYQNRYLPEPIPTFVIYHPSFLLRQPWQKKEAWADLQKINHFMRKLNVI